MKIVLTALNATYCHTNLALRYIRDYFRQHTGASAGCEIRIAEFSINDGHERIGDALFAEQADCYGFSCYIWNIEEILHVTADLKRSMPGAAIVLGGPEVSFETEDFLLRNPQVDFIVRGPGPKTFAELVLKLFAERAAAPDGQSDGGAVRAAGAGAGERILQGEPVPLSEFPFPYEGEEPFSKEKQYYVETSAGCPFRCTYCLSSAQTGVDFLPAGQASAILRRFAEGGAGIVKLVDRTFNAGDRRAAAIWGDLIELHHTRPFDTVFHFEIAADLLSRETLRLLAGAPPGIFRFECGVQSTTPGVLRNVDRHADPRRLFENIGILSERGNIELHLDLIAGLPGETPDSFRRSFNETIALRPGMLQLGFLKMLKGSRIRDDADRFGIVSSPYPPYPVIRTGTMSHADLMSIRAVANVLDIYYNSGHFMHSIRFLTERFFREDPYALYEGLAQAYKKAGGDVRVLSGKDRAGLFLRFGEELCLMPDAPGWGGAVRLFADLLKFDIYRYDRRGMPPGLKETFSGIPPAGSAAHPGMTRAEEAAFRNGPDGRPLCAKGRIEEYSFDAEILLAEGRVISARTAVLYELAGDKPVVKKIGRVPDFMCNQRQDIL